LIEWHNQRPDGEFRGKWRVLDGKEGEWSDLKFGALRWWPPPVSVKAHVGWVQMNKHLKCIDAYGTYEIHGSYPTIPNGVQWDSAWATHGVSAEVYTWKT
jgi:hypothetical protein